MVIVPRPIVTRRSFEFTRFSQTRISQEPDIAYYTKITYRLRPIPFSVLMRDSSNRAMKKAAPLSHKSHKSHVSYLPLTSYSLPSIAATCANRYEIAMFASVFDNHGHYDLRNDPAAFRHF